MKLLAVETYGIRSLPDRAFDVAGSDGAPAPVVVVTGPPSAGATTWMEAVAASLAKVARLGLAPSAEDLVRVGFSTGRVKTVWALDEEEQRYAGLGLEPTDVEVVFQRGGLGHVDADPGFMGLVDRYDHRPTTSKVVFIPSRRVIDASFATPADLEGEMRQLRLSPSTDKLGFLLRFAGRLAEQSPSRFERLGELFHTLCPHARLVPGAVLEVATGDGLRLPMRRLGTTEQSAFVLAAMVVLLALDGSVVMVDGFDLGLAPGEAARWLQALRAAAPRAQWVVAARAPEVLAAASTKVTLPERRPA